MEVGAVPAFLDDVEILIWTHSMNLHCCVLSSSFPPFLAVMMNPCHSFRVYDSIRPMTMQKFFKKCNASVLSRLQLSTLIPKRTAVLMKFAVFPLILATMGGCKSEKMPGETSGRIGEVTTRLQGRPTPRADYEIIRPFSSAGLSQEQTTSTGGR